MQLQQCLDKIDRVFGVNTILNQPIDEESITQYYRQSEIAFEKFHSLDGCIHMALNPQGVFNKGGYYGQANFIREHVQALKAKRVLEIGCGKGFNAIFLAAKNPYTQLYGIDLTPVFVKRAQKRATALRLPNVKFEIGNFNKLPYKDKLFDIVFSVETICHAYDKKSALAEIKRVLGPGKKFIIFDGFRKLDIEKLTNPTLRDACLLVEKTMGANEFDLIKNFLDKAKGVGYNVLEVQEMTGEILPTINRLSWLAKVFFNYESLGRLSTRLLPKYLTRNSIAGLLMPYTIRQGVHGYYRVCLMT